MFFIIDTATGNQADPICYATMESARRACDYMMKITGRPCHVRAPQDAPTHQVVLNPCV